MEDAEMKGLPRVFYASPSGDRRVNLAHNQSTPLLPYRGELPLVLYRMQEVWEDPPADAPPGTPPTVTKVRTPVIQQDFPIDWKRVMILVFPNKRGPSGTMLSFALSYETDVVTKGMARIHNASDRTLVMQFDDAKDRPLRLDPNKHIDFDPSKLTENAYSRIFVYENRDRGGERREMSMVHTSKLFFQEDTSNLFFLYPKGKRRIRIMRIAGHPDSDSAVPASSP